MAVEQKVEGAPKVGTSKPAPKPAAGKKPAQAAGKKRAETNGQAKPVVREKAAGGGKATATLDAKPVAGSTVYVRHMRNPRDAFILIKNQGVYGTDSNWATKDEFASAESAENWAKTHGLKVGNPSK